MTLNTSNKLMCALLLGALNSASSIAADAAADTSPNQVVPPAPVAPGDLPSNPLIKSPKITLDAKVKPQAPTVSDMINTIRQGDCNGLSEILKTGANPNQYDAFGYTPLTVAALDKRVQCIKSLLSAGADANIASSGGWTPLIGAAMSGASGDVMQTLVDKGADVNAKNQWGCTALYYAAGFGALGSVNYLLDKGAQYPGTGPECPTPMKIAELRGYPDLIKRFKLLEASGKTDAQAATPAETTNLQKPAGDAGK
jgi:hypothetical protein